MAVSLIRRAKNTVRLLLVVRLRCFRAVLPFVEGKKGLEIGGPSAVFEDAVRTLPIYSRVGTLDNCDFSRNTTWASHQEAFTFCPDKAPGKNIFRDASNLAS